MRKNTTIHNIGRELNLTPGTVSRALNHHPRISIKTKLFVQAKAEELQYQRNKIASSLRSGKFHNIGVIIPSAQMNFFGSVVHSIELMASSKEYSIILINNGYKRIAHVSGPQYIKSFKERLNGYSNVLEANKIKIDKKFILSGNLSIESGKIVLEPVLHYMESSAGKEMNIT